jgi:hypothetical protein
MTTAFVSALKRQRNPTYDQLLDLLLESMRSGGFTQRPQMSSSQEFDCGRPFSLEDALPNTNTKIGRVFRQKFDSASGKNPADQINALLYGFMLMF